MKLKRKQLSLNNVVGFGSMIDYEQDVFDQIAEFGTHFKELLVSNGYYSDTPIIFEYNPFAEERAITILTTIGNKVNLVGDNQSDFFYRTHLGFTTNYFYRHYDQEEAIPYDQLRQKIEANGDILLTFYHVLLDLDGDYVVDLYCEVDRI